MAPWSDSEECKRDHSFCTQLSELRDRALAAEQKCAELEREVHPLLAQARQEREHQLARGYDATNDANECHQHGEMAQAAAYMAWPTDDLLKYREAIEVLFPASWDIRWHSFRKGKTTQERMVVAVALLMAEWDRLAALQPSGEGE